MEYNTENSQQGSPVYSPAEVEYRQKCVTAMVLSIVGVGIFFLPVINIAGFVLSIIGYTKSKENRDFAASNNLPENTMNTAANVCGLIGIIIGAASVLMMVLAIVLFGALTFTAVSSASAVMPKVLRVAAMLLPLV